MRLWRMLSMVPFGVLAILVLGVPGVRADEPAEEPLPWDYDPYRVTIWIAGNAGDPIEEKWKQEVQNYLDRDFAALWRTEITTAPASMAALARRDFSLIDYETLSAADPVLAMKRNHDNASRIRYAADVAGNLGSIAVVGSHADGVIRRGAEIENGDIHGMAPLFRPIDGDLLALQRLWSDKATEAVLLPQGMARTLDPQPKLVPINVAGQMDHLFAKYDKIFIVSVDGTSMNRRVQVREIDGQMRLAGPVVQSHVYEARDIPRAIAMHIRQAFAPIVRLEDVGSNNTAAGRLRAGGLVIDPESPAAVGVGDFLQPHIRRDGRAGEPTLLEVIDWTYLRVAEQDGARLQMEIYSGRPGTLQGRRNSRTHRMAMKVRPALPSTTLRLHAKGAPDQPLAGYDVYEKDLETGDMHFVGSTDWDGRLEVTKQSTPMRLMYVKNGSAVLARLPVVPGQSAIETADLVPDDMRLRAEAYIRGVQNAIIDVVAIRHLLAAAIRMHIEKGDLQQASELLQKLREQPTFQMLANDMEQKSTEIRSRNPTTQKRIDNMFRDTRELLGKHLNPALVRELEGEFFAAGGVEAIAPGSDAAAAEQGSEPSADQGSESTGG